MFKRSANGFRIVLVVGGALASVATSRVESGDRAYGDDNGPTCPAGEACSDATPTGLYFGGMATGDVGMFGTRWPQATALGGQQTIRIFYDADASQAFDLPFEASLSTGALSIQETGASLVVLRGEDEGTARLRIAEPDTDLLYDRISLEARQVQTMRLVPSGRHLGYALDLLDEDVSFAVWVGGAARVTAAMYAADGARTVDENMAFDSAPGVSADPRGYVDTVEVSPASAGTVEINVWAGGHFGHFTMPAIMAAERITSFYAAEDGTITSWVGDSRVTCFRAESGNAVVLGSSWSYRASGNVSLAQTTDDVASGCIEITGVALGTASLTVTTAGVEATFEIEVVAGTSAALVRGPLAPVEPGLAGERADLTTLTAR